MSNQRATEMFKAYQAAADKLDYFMVGLSAASLAYVVQQYKPHRLIQSVDYLEPLSMVLLLASIYYGLQRAEAMVEGSRHNYVVLDANEQKAEVDRILSMPPGSGTNCRIHIPGRTVEGMDNLLRYQEEQIARGARAEKLKDAFAEMGLAYYKRRNFTLLAAMTLLTAHRLLAPYFAAA